jgi:hypothetical protein
MRRKPATDKKSMALAPLSATRQNPQLSGDWPDGEKTNEINGLVGPKEMAQRLR